MDSKIFRKAALERLSSPEQLDQLMQITNPRSWLILIALASLIGVVIIWGILGSIPTTVDGEGVLIYNSNRIDDIIAPATGTIQTLYVSVGETFEAGEILAQIAQEESAIDVISPYSGRVLEVNASTGSDVTAESELMQVEVLDEDNREMIAVIYVPIASAPELKTGQEVQVSPLNVQQSQYGFIRGRVASIAESVATYNDMLRILGREEFVQSILSQDIMVEVRIELERDADTISGYEWSSKTAENIQIQTGTPCYASITIKEERPISRVFPIFGLLLPVFGLIFIQPVHVKVN